MRWAFVAIMLFAGCGRIGYEHRTGTDAAPTDTMVPIIDAAPDGPPVCAADMLEIEPGSSVCIEIAQRGNLPWDQAKADCESLGRRLCADLEWYAGCINDPTLMDMTGDDYEWVAEESAGVAQKRGASDCNDMSSHQIIDPYAYRCCADK